MGSPVGISTEQLDAEEAQQHLGNAFNASSADTQPFRVAYSRAATNYRPEFQINPGTGLGPIKRGFTTQELDQMEADQLNDPHADLGFDQWKSARTAQHRLGQDTFGYGVSQIPGAIGGILQTAGGAIQEIVQEMPGDDETKSTADNFRDFGKYVGQLGSTGLEAGRQILLNTLENTQKVEQWLGSPGPKSSESPDARDQREYKNWQDNQMFNKELADGLLKNVFVTPIADPLKNTSAALAIGLAPENLVAEATGGLVQGSGLSNLAKSTAGRVFQALGKGGVVVDDTMQRLAEAAANRVQSVTGLSPEIQGKAFNYGAGAAATAFGVNAIAHGEENSNPIMKIAKPVLGYMMLRKGAATLRTLSNGAQVVGTIFREAADPIGPLRQAAMDGLSRNAEIPEQYRAAMGMASNTPGIDSTPARIANSTDFPQWVRKFAARLDNPAIVGTSRLLGAATEGAVGGAASALPFVLTSDNNAQAAENLGIGAVFGTAGGLASRVIGGGMAEQNADIARFLADTQLAGGDAVKASQLPHDRLAQLAAIQGLLSIKGGDVIAASQRQFDQHVANAQAPTEPHPGQPSIAGTDVVPMNGTDFEANRAALGGSGAAGWYFDAPAGQRPRLFINLDAENPADVHEFAHAILGSQVMDGGIRSDVRNWVHNTYGDKVPAMAREYAQRVVEAQNAAENARAAAAGHPIPQRPPIEDQVSQKVADLSKQGMDAGDADPLDWAHDEIFAEHLNQAGININDIRRGITPGVDPEAAAQNILSAQARVLGAAGAPIDPQTGAVKGSLSSIFRDNPLIGSSPELSRQLAKYVQSYGEWLNGIDGPAKGPKGTVLSPSGNPYELAKSRGIVLRPVEGQPGVMENEFLRVAADGTVTFKPQAEINRVDQIRAAQLAAALGTKLRTADDPTLGPRKVGGKVVIQGSRLPDNMMALKHFGPWIRSLFATFKNNEGLGKVWSSKYNRIGTGESGSYKILNMGNLRSEVFEHSSPFLYSVSKAGNLLAHVVDITNVRKKVLQAINEGRLPYHENNAAEVWKSVDQYLKNFKQGLPSENGLGIGKRDEVNAILFTGSKAHREANALAGDYGPQGCVRQLRVDRIEDMNPATDNDPKSSTYGQPKEGFHFDYFKVNNNMMPDTSAPQGTKEALAGGKPIVPSKPSDVGVGKAEGRPVSRSASDDSSTKSITGQAVMPKPSSSSFQSASGFPEDPANLTAQAPKSQLPISARLVPNYRKGSAQLQLTIESLQRSLNQLQSGRVVTSSQWSSDGARLLRGIDLEGKFQEIPVGVTTEQFVAPLIPKLQTELAFTIEALENIQAALHLSNEKAGFETTNSKTGSGWTQQERMAAKQSTADYYRDLRASQFASMLNLRDEMALIRAKPELAKLWNEYAKDPEVFQYGKTSSPNISDITHAVSTPASPITADLRNGKMILKSKNGMLEIKNPDSQEPHLFSLYADSAGKEKGGGIQLVTAAMDWIHNNGKQLGLDTSVSGINAIRRTSAMLGSSLRWGSTDHLLKPYSDQGVKWSTNTTLNIANLAIKEMENAFQSIPEARDWKYDFKSGEIMDGNGKSVSGKGLKSAVLLGNPERSGIGLSTLRRAVLTRSALEAFNGGKFAPQLYSGRSAGSGLGVKGIAYAAAGLLGVGALSNISGGNNQN